MRIDSAIITGSFSVNGDTFNDLGVFPSTGSNTFVGNQSIVGAVSASALTGSINYTNLTNVPTLVSGSEQIVSILSPLNSYTQSNDTTNTTQNSRLTSLESITGSLATTGSNTFIGTQTITGSLFVSSNLIVQGTSSLQNITASAVSIGTNIINLNTANPAIRYAGLVIGDSGSVGGSGSFLYDSVQDEMLFIHRGDSSVVTSSVVLMGPQTYDNVGNELYLTTNRLPKGAGNEHLSDSNISDTGTLVSINSATASFSGSVGIGTVTPSNLLHLYGTDGNSYLRWTSNVATTGTRIGYNGSEFRIDQQQNADITFRTNGSEKLKIASGGDILISNNGKFLQAVRNTGGAIIDIIGIQSGTDTLQIKGGTSGASNAINFYDTGGLIGTFYNSNLGIGTNTPSAKLHTEVNSSTWTSKIINTNTSTNNAGLLVKAGVNSGNEIILAQKADGTSIFLVDASGKVGIGTVSPSSRLGVRATGADGIVLEQDDGASNNSGRLFFLGDVQTYGMFNNAGDIRITHSAQPGNTSGTSFARFTNTGKYFRMESGTGGIQFGGDTAAANALDDYEEGTFTPTISGLQLSTMSASYVKIGSLVHVMATMAYISGTGSGNIISGLPFSAAGNHRSGVTFGNVNGVSWGSGATAPFGFIYNNQIACYGFSNNSPYTTADFSTFGSGDFIEFSGVYNIL
jgi:hypothetical protein